MGSALLLHGENGGLDEIAIAVAAFVVLWVAVKLAGRKPSAEEDDDDTLEADTSTFPPEAPSHDEPRSDASTAVRR
jgi:hypothetical protein